MINKDLKSRIPVAILYVAVIAFATLSGPIVASILLSIFFSFSLFEYVKGSLEGANANLQYILGAGLLFYFLGFVDQVIPYNKYLTIFSCAFFIINAAYLILNKKALILKFPVFFSSLLYVALPFIISILSLKTIPEFSKILLGVFIIIWLNDAGAYFVGRAIGKNKLMPSVSPGKTIEGFVGGGLIGILAASIVYKYLGLESLTSWIIIAIIIWITGAIGDLIESSWKRNLNLKDSGTLMQGHGGFLDRLDSFIYSIPFVVLFLIFY